MKKIAVIASITEFKAFCTFLKRIQGVEFVSIQHPYQLQGLELSGYIDTGTVKNNIDTIILIAKSCIR